MIDNSGSRKQRESPFALDDVASSHACLRDVGYPIPGLCALDSPSSGVVDRPSFWALRGDQPASF